MRATVAHRPTDGMDPDVYKRQLLALAGAREDIAIRALSPSSPVREVVAATPEGTRLTAAAAAMRQILTDVSSRFVGPDII